MFSPVCSCRGPTRLERRNSGVVLRTSFWSGSGRRARTGEGQEVDVSLLGGNMYGASLDLQAYLAIGGEQFLRPVVMQEQQSNRYNRYNRT